MTSAITPYDPVNPVVTLVTALSRAADLSEAEYRQIYASVAAGRSLRNVALALRSEVSFGWWAGYAAGEKQLDRDRRNELRAYAGLPPLPPTPAEAVAAGADPDAAVYHVGSGIASRVVLVGADVPAVQLRINGNCAVVAPAADAPLLPCNGRYTASPQISQRRLRPRYFRPCLSLSPVERAVQLRRLLAEAEAEII